MSLAQLFVRGKSKGHNPVLQTTEEDPKTGDPSGYEQ
jgi:hypothetical protein